MKESIPGKAEAVSWPAVGITLLSLTALLLFIYRETAQSIVGIWTVSDTFEHGFLVIPIFMYLCWLKRDALFALPPERSTAALVALLGSGFFWFVAVIFGVMLFQHVALVMMVVSTIWALIGTRAANVILFPLCFLFFAAPIGDELVPVMMDFTADIVVIATRASGIPIFREGLYFSLPSGDWSVVEACSGIRYLIASLVLGSVFAYVNLERMRTRACFMVFAITAPIIANGLRAYMIVMIAHHSNNRLAMGVDHFIYGWLFFGIVMTVLFSFGIWLRRFDTQSETSAKTRPKKAPAGKPLSRQALLGQFAVVMLLLAAWPVYSNTINKAAEEAIDVSSEPQTTNLDLPEGSSWRLDQSDAISWRPRYSGYDSQLLSLVNDGASNRILVNVLSYEHQKQGKEMVSGINILLEQKHEKWRLIQSAKDQLMLNGTMVEVNRSVLQARTQELTLWSWYQVGNYASGNRYIIKLVEGFNKLLSRQVTSKAIFIAVDSPADNEKAVLNEFLEDHHEQLH